MRSTRVSSLAVLGNELIGYLEFRLRLMKKEPHTTCA